MPEHLLAPLFPWWQLVLIAVALLAIGELGFLVGRHRRTGDIQERKAQAGIHVAALLGLLGLMLAFCFGAVQDRYSARKALVLDEANSIGTTYLRADLLPPPHRERVRALLREYVALRLEIATPKKLGRAIQRSGELQAQLWTEATEAARANPSSIIVAIFIQSLNETIDLHESRVTVALHQRLPATIVIVLYTIAALAIGVLGVTAGLGRTRSTLPTTALIVAITAVVTLIVDLDNPAGSMFHVSQSAMRDLQSSMTATAGSSSRSPRSARSAPSR